MVFVMVYAKFLECRWKLRKQWQFRCFSKNYICSDVVKGVIISFCDFFFIAVLSDQEEDTLGIICV